MAGRARASLCRSLLKIVGNDYPVPVKSIDVQLTVRGFVGNVVTTLLYKNTEQNPIEAVFEFPIDDQSAVYQFEAKIEDRVIIAECQEKKQAKQTYDDAVDSGRTAMLLEEDDASGDIFRCLVGNLPPGAEATIKFAYVIELQLSPEGAVTFVLPTQLNPRYNPSESDGGTANPVNVSYIAPGSDQPYAFTFRADVFYSGKISSIKAASDKDDVVVKSSENGCQAQVELSKFVADHDFRLEVKYEEQYEPHLIIEKADTTKDGILCQDVMMLNFFPQLNESEFSNKHEFIFVIDRSGSMAGGRIKAAQAALLVFLKSLPTGCYFNIVGFGSSFALLFPDGSREYSKDSLKLACDYQANLDASFSGTEMLLPLKAIYSKQPMTTHSRQIMLLTDGDVSNTREVISLVQNNAGNSRLFSLGIGEGASTSLVKGIARVGRGTAEFVMKDSTITSVVMKMLKAAMQTSVTDLKLKWRLSGNDKLVQVPSKMPPVFSGDRLIIYAINAGKKSVSDGVVLLKGKAGERSVEFTITVDSTHNLSPFDAALPVHRLAAKAQIKQLEDGEKENAEKNKAEILLLSVAANIVSRHTSMVGVDKDRKDKVVGEMIQREVPLMMSRPRGSALGWAPACYMAAAAPNAKAKTATCHRPVAILHEVGSNAAMSTVPQHLPYSSVGFGPQGFGPSAQHFSQPHPPFGPLLATQPPAAAVPGPAQHFYYGHSPAECSAMAAVQSCPPANIPLPLPDLSKPPPGFPLAPGCGPTGPPPQPPMPYLMAPLVKPCGAGASQFVATYVPQPRLGHGYSGANSQSGFDRYSDLVCAGHTVPQRATAAGGQSSSVYMSIISEQTFTGCWELNTELSNLLHVSLDELQKSAPVKSHDVWATVLALSLLSLKFADKKAEWEMIEMKATQWLSRQQLEGHTVDELLLHARNVLDAAK